MTLTPAFQETELDVNTDYVFTVTTEPEGVRLKDLEYSVDDPTAVFSTASEDNTQAVLHTGEEGTVNIYVKQGDVVSNYLSFNVADITARKADRKQNEDISAENNQFNEIVEAPYVVGLSLDEASAVLKEAGLSAKASYRESTEYEKDYIFEQRPEAGEVIEKGGSMELVISSGRVEEDVEEEATMEEERENDMYILPFSDQRALSKSDLEDLTADECRLARNEIYARHGRRFKDESIQAYFNSKDWYEGTIDPDDFSENILSDTEKANRDLIVEYEKEKGYNQ